MCCGDSEQRVRFWHVLQTETAVRFSLVTHGRDSPEGLRDVRGFASKFYTSEGNWVGAVSRSITIDIRLH